MRQIMDGAQTVDDADIRALLRFIWEKSGQGDSRLESSQLIEV